jgi:predicted amidohydrolase
VTTPASTLRLGLAQFTASLGDVEANVARVLDFMQDGAGEGAELVCLPELCLTGYLLEAAAYDDLTTSLHEAGARLREASRDLQIRLIYGTAHRWGGSLHNCVVMSEPDGSQTVYSKVHMVDSERAVFRAGTDLVTSPDGDIALGCCYDLAFPEFSVPLALAGARVLCFPMAWERERSFVFEGIAAARAIENVAYVICVNQTGDVGEFQFYGGSRVVGPLGETVCRMGDETGLAIADLDLGLVSRLRARVDTRTYPLLTDRRPNLIVTKGQWGTPIAHATGANPR